MADPIGAVRMLAGHVFVRLHEPADEPWHIVYSAGQQTMSGWQSDEDMKDATGVGYLPIKECVRGVQPVQPAPSSSDAPNQTATLMAALIEQELELAHSGEGYEPKAVAEEIVKDHVVPRLEAKDAEIEWLRTQLRNDVATARTLVSRLVDATTGTWFGWEDPHHDPLIVADQAVGIARERLVRITELRAELEREREIKAEVLDTNRLAIQTLRGEVDSWIKSTIRADGEAYAAQQKLNDLYKALGEQKLWELGIQPPRDGQPDTCPHGDTNCKTVLGKTVLDQPYHGNCHPWHYHLRARLNGVYGALAGQGNELAPKLRAAIGFLDESVGQPDTEATEQAPVPFCAEHVQVGKTIRVCSERVPDGFCPEHGDVGPPRVEQPVTPATPTPVAVVELDADDPLAQRVEHDSRMDGVDTPGCDCGHSGMGEGWHSSDCTWKQIVAAAEEGR